MSQHSRSSQLADFHSGVSECTQASSSATRIFTRRRWFWRQRVQVVDDLEARRLAEVVDGGDVDQEVEGELRPVAQRRRRSPARRRARSRRVVSPCATCGVDDALAEGLRAGRASSSSALIPTAAPPCATRRAGRCTATNEEDRHRREAGPAELPEDHRPRVHEHHLDVEDDEEDGGQVELHREAPPRRAARLVAALERLELGLGAVARAEQAIGVDHHRHDDQRQGEGDQHGMYWASMTATVGCREVSNTVAYAKPPEVSTRLTVKVDAHLPHRRRIARRRAEAGVRIGE